jgi:NADPH:quinone reductase-like Zn-dependent oxidoreductase
MCDNEKINGVTRNGGCTVYLSLAFIYIDTDCELDAEYCILRTEAIVRIPTNVDPASVAPLLCAGVTVFNSIRNMHITPGETVAVLGLGGLGHLAIQYAARMGYRVVALSSSGEKEHFAKKLGAHDYIDGSKGDPVEAQEAWRCRNGSRHGAECEGHGPLAWGTQCLWEALILGGK